MIFYTYFHTRNDTGAVFYVGKGKGSRAYEMGRNFYWDNIVAKCGYTVHIASEWKTKDEALEHEIFLIACFKDIGVPLTNMTPGGEGGDTTSGRKWVHKGSDRAMVQLETIESLLSQGWVLGSGVKGRTAIGDLFRGVPKSPEMRAQISKTLSGRKLPKWHAEAIANGQRGMKRSTENKANISKALTGKVRSSEHCANLSSAKLGKAVVNNGIVEKRVTQDELKTFLNQGWVQGLLKTTCPHCGHVGGRSHLTRWHFDNCKVK